MNMLTKAKRLSLNFLRPQPDPPNLQEYQRWVRDNGDRTLRLFYDLTPDSVVFDLGGYEGQWASDIFAMYCCFIHVFEPVPQFADQIKQRFAHNPKIQSHPLGLSNTNQVSRIAIQGNASSLFAENPDTEIRLVKASDFLNEHHIQSIDLIKINIEGGEYDLLDHLIETQIALQVRDIQVQFHNFVPDSRARMVRIQEQLAKTHELTYQYAAVWENWRRKSS